MTKRTVEEYLTLPYHIEVVYDDSGEEPGWVARVLELPGCMTQAPTFEALVPMIQDAMYSWIEIGLEDGHPIPEPFTDEAYSGKFVVRVPRRLHRELVEAAQRDGVSLNAFVNVACARAVGAQLRAEPKRDEEAVGTQGSLPATPAPAWGTLSAWARQAMLGAGLQAEAEQVDERLFANWLDRQFQQVQAAVQSNYMQDAFTHLNQLHQALGIAAQGSPLMQVFDQVVIMLAGELTEVGRLRRGIVGQAMIQARVSTEVLTRQEAVTHLSEGQETYRTQRHEYHWDDLSEGEIERGTPKRPF